MSTTKATTDDGSDVDDSDDADSNRNSDDDDDDDDDDDECPARSQDPFSYILLPFDAALGPICLACLGPAGQTGTPTSIVLFILLPACGYGCLPVQVSCINSNKPVPKGQKYAFLRTKRTPACSVLFSFK